ncbi:MAG: DUF2703 domain-containing protein [Calditerrivibrio sp.]|nr:DUF2703 domain-containing protein [Calditerrivibrio sp.]
MKVLNIKWQRLLSEGETCPRCALTEQEIKEAISVLKESLLPLGVDVVLQKGEISLEDFERDPLRSNQIWLNERLLEDWLGGTFGQSPCCDVCGPAECRTVEIDGYVYESIPAELIIKAGLFAASHIIAKGEKGQCCEINVPKRPNRSCC